MPGARVQTRLRREALEKPCKKHEWVAYVTVKPWQVRWSMELHRASAAKKVCWANRGLSPATARAALRQDAIKHIPYRAQPMVEWKP